MGVERGWQEREGRAGSRVAGVRTFSLIGLLGGIWGALLPLVGGVALGLAALGFTGGLAAFEWRRGAAEKSFSATDFVAGLLAFALGGFAVLGNMVAAGAAGVAATAMLAEREALHRFLERVTWTELRAAVLLLAMTFVLLPILPDRNIDPWDSLNLHRVWLMTILIAAISYAGYVAVRLAGSSKGLMYAGAVGGLISSTLVTYTYSRLAKTEPGAGPGVSVGIVASWIVSLVRMSAIATFLAPMLLAPLVAPIAASVIVLSALGVWFWRGTRNGGAAPNLHLTNPFDLFEVLRFGALLGAVMMAASFLTRGIGEIGILPLAAVSGTVDVDPITISSAQMAGTAVAPKFAALAILIAAAANLALKAAVALAVGGGRQGLRIGMAAALAVAAGAGAYAAGWT